VDLKKPLKFESESGLYAIVTIALQYSLAGGQGMVSIQQLNYSASLSHTTPKSMFRLNLLEFTYVVMHDMHDNISEFEVVRN